MTALDVAYSGITRLVADLDDHHLLLPSGCHGWSVADLMFHLTLDAQRALVAFASPVDGPADVDASSYWHTSLGSDDGSHAQWVRRSAAAFTRPTGVLGPWRDTAPAAVRAAAAADPAGFVTTQGHVLTVPDFVATLVTEAAIHHLDLIAPLPDAAGPAPEMLAVVRSTLDGLGDLPPQWKEREAQLRPAAG